jgi:hypothetical protein
VGSIQRTGKPDDPHPLRAALLGFTSGARRLTGLAAVASTGHQPRPSTCRLSRLPPGRSSRDTTPLVPSRLAPPALAGRVALDA